MCARFGLEQGILPFLEFLGIAPEDVPPPPPNIASGRPTDPMAVVLRNPKTQRIELRYPRWGLVPHWSKGPIQGQPLLNARIETLEEKPAFSKILRLRRCVIPLLNFQESSKSEGKVYRYSMKDGSHFGAAGLWDYRRMDDGSTLVSCAMITCEANELVGRRHHRMPWMLSPEDMHRWLDPTLDDPVSLFQPMDPSLMLEQFERDLKSVSKRPDLSREVEEQEPLFA
jgi:putative SOS response-associated peptidase YedK